MGKTNAIKEKERARRLAALPKKERLAKQAAIKKKEGRVLSGPEKHAMKMSGDYGAIMNAWENLLRVADEGGHREAKHSTKHDAVAPLWKLIQPQFETGSRSPKMSRVLQSCVKHGDAKQLESILVEASKVFVTTCSDSYAHFIIVALVRHANHDLFRKILNLVLTHMTALVGSKFGAYVIHSVYTSKMCSAVDRDVITLGVFKDSVAVMKQWKGYPELEKILLLEVDHRKRLITALFSLLDKLVSQKEAFGYPFVQRLLGAFFKYGGKHEIQELAVTLKPHVAVFCDSREGSILASQVIAVLPPPQRKEALAAFKGYTDGGLVGLACGKYTAPVVARLLDLIYDPQILWKYVTGVLAADMEPVLASPYGHMVLLHILTPDDDRKTKAMLPTYRKDYNLFSRGNEAWNQVNWTDVEGNPETVEICPNPAQQTHAFGIRQVLPAIVEYLLAQKEKGEVTESKKAKSGAALHVSRIAKEVCFLLDNDAEYAAAINKALPDAEHIQLLRDAAPRKTTRQEEGEEEKEAEPAVEARPSKKARASTGSMKETPVKAGRKSASAAVTPTPKRVSGTPSAAATTPRHQQATHSSAAKEVASSTKKRRLSK